MLCLSLCPPGQDRLGALVDTLCVEAVEKILQMVQVSAAPCDVSSDGAMRTQVEEGDDDNSLLLL